MLKLRVLVSAQRDDVTDNNLQTVIYFPKTDKTHIFDRHHSNITVVYHFVRDNLVVESRTLCDTPDFHNIISEFYASVFLRGGTLNVRTQYM